MKNRVDQRSEQTGSFKTRGKKWASLLWVMFGALFSGGFFVMWLHSQFAEYRPPTFEELRISSGTLSFTRWWKSSGGDAVIRLDDGNALTLTCGGVFVDSPCFRKQVDGVWMELEGELTGQSAIVWWYPENDNENYGRLYQMKAGNRLLLRYEQQVDWYTKDHKLGRPHALVSAIVMLLVTVFYARRDLKRRG